MASKVRFTFDLLDGGPGGSNVTSTRCLLRPEQRAYNDSLLALVGGRGGNGEGVVANFDVDGITGGDLELSPATALAEAEMVTMEGEGPVAIGRWTVCREPVIYSDLPSGSYEFLMIPIDDARNLGAQSLPYSFQVPARALDFTCA